MELHNTATSYGIVILAAGNSSRLGRPKQLLPYQQQTLLVHTIQQALVVPDCAVVVILGAYATDIQPLLPKEVTSIINNQWSLGMGSSIQTAMQYLRPLSHLQGCLLTVCDQPYISSGIFNTLIDTHRSTLAPIVASSYDGTIGVPAFFHSTLFEELAKLHGQSGAKPVIERYRPEVATIPFPQGTTDIDTIEDYQRLLGL